jgi:hypothetical protein
LPKSAAPNKLGELLGALSSFAVHTQRRLNVRALKSRVNDLLDPSRGQVGRLRKSAPREAKRCGGDQGVVALGSCLFQTRCGERKGLLRTEHAPERAARLIFESFLALCHVVSER